MADEWTCVRCERPMEEGFILDNGGVVYGVGSSYWVEGKAQKGAWGGVKLGGKERYKISALRCVNCGRLELFAREPAE